MRMMIIVSTIVSEDGVIGLNGKQYLLDDNDELKYFDSLHDAKMFLSEFGVDPDGDFIEYEEVNDG